MPWSGGKGPQEKRGLQFSWEGSRGLEENGRKRKSGGLEEKEFHKEKNAQRKGSAKRFQAGGRAKEG